MYNTCHVSVFYTHCSVSYWMVHVPWYNYTCLFLPLWVVVFCVCDCSCTCRWVQQQWHTLSACRWAQHTKSCGLLQFWRDLGQAILFHTKKAWLIIYYVYRKFWKLWLKSAYWVILPIGSASYIGTSLARQCQHDQMQVVLFREHLVPHVFVCRDMSLHTGLHMFVSMAKPSYEVYKWVYTSSYVLQLFFQVQKICSNKFIHVAATVFSKC